MREDSSSNFKWYVLVLAALTYALVTGIMRMCMPVLFEEISADLHLNLVQIGTVWGMDPLGGVFIALFSGLLIDRFGVKRTLVPICILAGVLGALRGLSGNFTGLSATMFTFGLIVATTPILVPKVLALWFPERQLGLASGILTTMLTVGYITATTISATVLSPLLGGWRNVLFLYGVPPVVLGFLWLITYRERALAKPTVKTADTVSLRQALLRVIPIKQVWIIGILQFGSLGAYLGMQGYLPTYLRGIGWSTGSADGAMTVLVGASLFGTIPIGLLSDRLGLRKPILLLVLLALVITRALMPLAQGIGIWVLVALNGLLSGSMFPLFTTLIVETRGVGRTYAGTAFGIVNTLGMLGQFVSAPLGNSVAHINSGLPFVVWALLSGVVLVGFFFIKEQKQSGLDLPQKKKELPV